MLSTSNIVRLAPEQLSEVLGRDLVLRLRLFVRFVINLIFF